MLRFLTLIFLLFTLCSLRLYATHIVGGEFELIHINGYNYEVRLNQYFDHIHGNPGAEDAQLIAYVFRKSDNGYVSYIILSNMGSEFVPYTNPECRKTGIQLQTRKITYSNHIYFSPDIYKDPDGYYIVWERCCRNGIINNIKEPERSGQAFYLEFPPVVKDNVQFINSSPILFPPLSDYAVVNQLYYVDFGGVDPDGDSLVYSMEVPLRGNSSPELPVPNATPAPYRLISWEYGYNISNVIPGPVPLNVDSKGFITVVPDRKGLFVFSVKCEEYRDNVKIGEVVRDFQLLVVEVDVGNKPKIQAFIPETNDFYKEGEVIKFAANDPKCFEIWVTDPDENEKILVKALPVNFSADLESVFSERQGIIANENDTLKFEVCLPNCAFKVDEPFYIDFIAMDDACSLPLMDTVRMAFLVEPELNQKPVFINPLQNVIKAEVSQGKKFTLPLSGRDDDGDKMKITVLPQGFNLEDFGMTYNEIFNDFGAIDAVFDFDADCNIYDFSLKSSFTVFLELQDITECKTSDKDIIMLQLKVNFPSENAPVISTDLNTLLITALPDELIEFNVFGSDKDNDLINLVGFGEDFAFSSYDMKFTNKSGIGNLESLFSWNTECSNLHNRDNFTLKFVVDDRGSCKESQFDTLSVKIQILAPSNEAPTVSIDDIRIPEVHVAAGKKLEVKIIGFDIDNDSISLKMEDHPQYENLNYEFQPVIGKGKVTSVFRWNPECSLIGEGSELEIYNFNFIVADLRCINAKSDTITLTVNVEDLIFKMDELQPYNVFSPNDDLVNDYFEIANIPPDNCKSQYLGIEIFNRWGKRVFYDTRRDFKWDGKGFGTGVYYYVLKFSNIDYKGTVSIIH